MTRRHRFGYTPGCKPLEPPDPDCTLVGMKRHQLKTRHKLHREGKMNIKKLARMAQFKTKKTVAEEARDEILHPNLRDHLRGQWDAPNNPHANVLVHVKNEETDKSYFITAWDGKETVAVFHEGRMRHISLRDIYEGGRCAVHLDRNWNIETRLMDLREYTDDIERFRIYERKNPAKRYTVATQETPLGARWRVFEEGKTPITMTPLAHVYAVDEESALRQAQMMVSADTGEWLEEADTEFLPDNAKQILDSALKPRFDDIDVELKYSAATNQDYTANLYFQNDYIANVVVNRARKRWVVTVQTRRGNPIVPPAKGKTVKEALKKLFDGPIDTYIQAYKGGKAAGRTPYPRTRREPEPAPARPAAPAPRPPRPIARRVSRTPAAAAPPPAVTSAPSQIEQIRLIRDFLSPFESRLKDGFRRVRDAGDSHSARQVMADQVQSVLGVSRAEFLANFVIIREYVEANRFVSLARDIMRMGYVVRNNRLVKER